jgi:hypothetical protein
VIAVRNVEETKLAWAVIEAGIPHLSPCERNHVFVSVGAGDTFTTIRVLLKLLSARRIPLPADLVQRCSAWLDAYALHEEELHLRRLIGRYVTPDAMARREAGFRSSIGATAGLP